jgi:hypothetical protein
MAARKKRIQVVVSEEVYEEIQALVRRLDSNISAAAGLLITTGLAQFDNMGLVRRVGDSSPAAAAGPKRRETKKADAPRDDAGMGFRPKGEYEEEQADGVMVPWVPSRGYMAGL